MNSSSTEVLLRGQEWSGRGFPTFGSTFWGSGRLMCGEREERRRGEREKPINSSRGKVVVAGSCAFALWCCVCCSAADLFLAILLLVVVVVVVILNEAKFVVLALQIVFGR